jgi:hypothetical protein
LRTPIRSKHSPHVDDHHETVDVHEVGHDKNEEHQGMTDAVQSIPIATVAEHSTIPGSTEIENYVAD